MSFFSLLGYPLRQSLKNVGVKGIRRLTPDGVREANINNAAGHRLYVTLVPVSHRRFLRASVRVNHPRVAAIRTAKQVLPGEIARHVATWSEWLLARTADKPEQRDRGRWWPDPQRVVALQRWVTAFGNADDIRIKIDFFACPSLSTPEFAGVRR